MSRTLLVFATKNFKITIPDDARVTFGPFSPPGASKTDRYAQDNSRLAGTLRVYEGPTKSTENIIGVFTNVLGFRDLNLGYAEEVAREEGAILWKSDEHGYEREEKVQRDSSWADPEPKKLTTKKGKKS